MTLGTVLEITYHLGIKFAKSEKIKENPTIAARPMSAAFSRAIAPNRISGIITMRWQF
jgi:hypothetical protein